MKDKQAQATPPPSKFAQVATVRCLGSGRYQVKLPPSIDRIFDEKEQAIAWAASQGWGVHLTK